jgi:transcriptional regulator with XRE-family HTH domain
MNIELIAERLKKIRLEKGLSLEELQKKTKVHINILKAIEGEALTNLSPVYLKSFIKIYCNALDVDPKDYVPDCREPAAKVILGSHKSAEPLLGAFMGRLKGLRLSRKWLRPLFIGLTVLFCVIIISKIGGCISSMRPSRQPLSSAPAAKQQPQALPKSKEAKAVVSSQEAKIPRESSGGLRLVISAKEKVFVSVKADGRVLFRSMLERGRSESWLAKEKFELTLGSASAVELIVNGRHFKDLGRRGQPLRNIIITEKDGLKIPR